MSMAPHWFDAQFQLQACQHGFQARYEKLRSVVGKLSLDPLVSQVLRFEPPIPQSCMVHGYVCAKSGAEDLEIAHQKAIHDTGSRLWNSLGGEGYGAKDA